MQVIARNFGISVVSVLLLAPNSVLAAVGAGPLPAPSFSSGDDGKGGGSDKGDDSQGSSSGKQTGKKAPEKEGGEKSKEKKEKKKKKKVPDESGLSEEELKELEGKIEQEENKVGPEVFDEGVKLYYEKNYIGACKRLWDYMAGNDQGADKFGYAEFYLAKSLEGLGFTHAAMEYYYNVAKNRTKPELLPDALRAIEKLTRHHPFDHDLILMDLIYDTTFGFLPKDLRNFVEYYQGLMDYRNGFIRWGRNHFKKIEKNTYYAYKADYVRAVYELVKYNLEEAIKIFQSILDSDIKQADVINNARQSIARILFEQKKYEEAYEMYETINSPIEKQASVFMEEAWTQYYLKNYRRAMGLLYSLEAPAFRKYLNPERFVLKALIYKNLCHYNAAKDAVAEFREKYGEALETIYNRVGLEQDPIIMDGALQEPVLIELGRFRELLEDEVYLLGNYVLDWSDNGLLDHLAKIYDLKIREVERKIKKKLDEAINDFAEKLLEFEEQMNLLEYEIGLAIYKRIKGTPTEKKEQESQGEIPLYGAKVYYPFDGEFWNDEMHDFRFFIEDRCFGEERWE